MAKRKDSGFTIIEVALVLAIAGLIFLVVFLAVPALQRNQRNDAIRRDIAFVAEAMSSYQSNYNALPADSTGIAVPSTATTGFGQYLRDGLSTNTTTIVVQGSEALGTVPDVNNIVVMKGAKCNTGPAGVPIVEGASARNAAIVGSLDMGGANRERYCQEM